MKKYFLISLLIFSIDYFSQIELPNWVNELGKDTVIIIVSKRKHFPKTKKQTYFKNYSHYGDTISFVNKNLEKTFDKYVYKDSYCIFYDKNMRKIEEGIFMDLVKFIGDYQSYHANGIIRSRGLFHEGMMKMGRWEYFNKKGELIKEEYY